MELLVMIRENRIQQQELARRLGLTPKAISYYIRPGYQIPEDRADEFRRAIRGEHVVRKPAKGGRPRKHRPDRAEQEGSAGDP